MARFGTATVPVPLSTDHRPVPVPVGVLAAKNTDGEVIQTVCKVPAFETEGTSSTFIDIVAVLKQPPLVIVQASVLSPRLRLVTGLLPWPGLVTLPVPEVTVQLPVPSVGVLPVSIVVGELIQTV